MEEFNATTKKPKKRDRYDHSENNTHIPSSSEKKRSKRKRKRKSRVPKMTPPHVVAIEYYLRRERIERSYAHLLAFLHSDIDLSLAKHYFAQLKENPRITIDEEKGVVSYLVVYCVLIFYVYFFS
jgi:hypothetical protein